MLESDDLVGLGMAAHQARLKKNDPRVVTYQIDRNINYTNFCTEYCSFCAFYRPLGAKDGYILPFEEIYKKIDEMLELGGTGILLQGGLHPDLQIGYYENLLLSLKARYRRLHRVYPLDVCRGEYGARQKGAGSHRRRLLKNSGGQPAVSRQH